MAGDADLLLFLATTAFGAIAFAGVVFVSVRWKTMAGIAMPANYPQRIGPFIWLCRRWRGATRFGGLLIIAGAVMWAADVFPAGGLVAWVGLLVLGLTLLAVTVVRTFEHYSGSRITAPATLTVPMPGPVSWPLVALLGGIMVLIALGAFFAILPQVPAVAWALLVMPAGQIVWSAVFLVRRSRPDGELNVP